MNGIPDWIFSLNVMCEHLNYFILFTNLTKLQCQNIPRHGITYQTLSFKIFNAYCLTSLQKNYIKLYSSNNLWHCSFPFTLARLLSVLLILFCSMMRKNIIVIFYSFPSKVEHIFRCLLANLYFSLWLPIPILLSHLINLLIDL